MEFNIESKTKLDYTDKEKKPVLAVSDDLYALIKAIEDLTTEIRRLVGAQRG